MNTLTENPGEEPALPQVKVARLRPDDVLVLTLPEGATVEEFRRACKAVRETFDTDRRALVLTGCTVHVMRPEDADAMAALPSLIMPVLPRPVDPADLFTRHSGTARTSVVFPAGPPLSLARTVLAAPREEELSDVTGDESVSCDDRWRSSDGVTHRCVEPKAHTTEHTCATFRCGETKERACD